MKLFLAAASMLVACNELPPLKVPGPTTARPPATTTTTAAQVSATPLVSQRNAISKVVSIRVVFAAGSSDDPKGKEGATNLAAALTVDSGTKELTVTELTKRLYPFAASINAQVDRDTTVFEVEVASNSLASFYPLFRDVMLTPRMDDESFTRNKSRAVSALTDDLRSSNDEELGKEALQATLYRGHPYGHPSVGTEAGLGSLSLADVQAQRTRVFCKDRVTVGVAGGFPEGFDKTVAGDLAKLPACAGPRDALPAPPKTTGLKVVIVDKPSADSTAISMGSPIDMTRASDEYPAVFFFSSYLGLHRQSAGVLYQELREARGFNYGDYAYSEFFQQEGWERYPAANIARRQQQFSIWVRPTKPQNGAFALRGALYFYRKLLDQGISDEEITRFRGFTSRYFALEQQTESRRLGYAIDDLAYGLKEPWLDRMRAAWQSLTASKLKDAVSKKLTPNDLTIVIVTKDAAALKKTLIAGTATPPTYDSPKPARVLNADKEIQVLPLGLKDEDVMVVPATSLFHD
jgi:zinc protease